MFGLFSFNIRAQFFAPYWQKSQQILINLKTKSYQRSRKILNGLFIHEECVHESPCLVSDKI